MDRIGSLTVLHHHHHHPQLHTNLQLQNYYRHLHHHCPGK